MPGKWSLGLPRIAALMLVVALAACSATHTFHGFAPSDDELAQLKVGRDTRDRVDELFGRPTMAGMMRDDAWYYTWYKVRNFAYRAPETVERQLVAISFRKNGTIDNIERFTLEDGRVVALSRRVTESNIKGIGFIRQALGNIGRFNAADVLGN